MSQIAYADPAAPPPGRPVQPDRASGPSDAVVQRRARLAALLPFGISAAVQTVFFVRYWLPETGAAPLSARLLDGLAPLASAVLVSGGVPLTPGQSSLGLPGLVLLLSGWALWALSRTRFWVGRPAMVCPALAGVIAVIAMLVTVAVDEAPGGALSVLLGLAWTVCAGYAAGVALLGRFGTPEPKTWRHGLPVLGAFVLLGACPTAVGRALFAPELRDVAAGLQSNQSGLRLAALWTPTTIPLYVCGIGMGLLVWVAYQWWPPRRDRVFAMLSVALAALLVTIGVAAWPTSTLAARRVTHLLYASPAEETDYRCGTRTLVAPGVGTRPLRTLTVAGLRCGRATVFDGYREVSRWSGDASLSPVEARLPDGSPMAARLVVAQYDDVLVTAASPRLDSRADRLIAHLLADGTPLWEYRCATPDDFGFRFAGVPVGDDPALGQVTRGETGPRVVLRCGRTSASFDPQTGPRR